VFLTAMKELPATLLLSPIGFQTLSTRIWSEAAEGRFAAGALPALVLISISALSVGWTLRLEQFPGGTGLDERAP
jgi:iron(III) transport system permease protein